MYTKFLSSLDNCNIKWGKIISLNMKLYFVKSKIYMILSLHLFKLQELHMFKSLTYVLTLIFKIRLIIVFGNQFCL